MYPPCWKYIACSMHVTKHRTGDFRSPVQFMLLYCAICMFHVTCRDLGRFACMLHAWNSHSHMYVLSTLLGLSQVCPMHVAGML